MNIFLYRSADNTQGDQLQAMVKKQVKEDELVCIDNVSNMEATLRLLLKAQDIIILLVSTTREMDEFLKIRSLLQDVKLILVLPHTDNDLITKGHLLRPRFLDIASDNKFTNVAAVMLKMLQAQSLCKNLNKSAQFCNEENCTNHSL